MILAKDKPKSKPTDLPEGEIEFVPKDDKKSKIRTIWLVLIILLIIIVILIIKETSLTERTWFHSFFVIVYPWHP